MTSRTIFDVAPDGEQWKVGERNGLVHSRHTTKEEAVGKARELAHEQEPSQVVVRTSDGKIEEEFTYQEDPYPPEG